MQKTHTSLESLLIPVSCEKGIHGLKAIWVNLKNVEQIPNNYIVKYILIMVSIKSFGTSLKAVTY